MLKTQQAGVYQDLMSLEMIVACSNPETGSGGWVVLAHKHDKEN